MKNSDSYSISLMCNVLNVSRASFYKYWYYSSKKAEYTTFVLSKILTIYFNSKRIYGAPRIAKVLSEEGLNISVKTVGKYMRILNIKSISSSAFPKKKSTMSDNEKSLIVNLIKNLDIYRPNQVWTTDITYIKTKEDGWVYLSTIIDLFSRKVIAWNVGANMKKELVITTLNNAFASRGNPTNVIVHSDKGSQYRSFAWRRIISEHNCLFIYTSLNHSCDENSNQESFHASLKKEWLYQKSFNTIHDVKRAIFEYIEGFYNNYRIHSSIGYNSPVSFENKFFNNIPLLPLSTNLT